jgi:hypothetical protein
LAELGWPERFFFEFGWRSPIFFAQNRWLIYWYIDIFKFI